MNIKIIDNLEKIWKKSASNILILTTIIEFYQSAFRLRIPITEDQNILIMSNLRKTLLSLERSAEHNEDNDKRSHKIRLQVEAIRETISTLES